MMFFYKNFIFKKYTIRKREIFDKTANHEKN